MAKGRGKILSPTDGNQVAIMQMLMQTAVKEALAGGAPIPMAEVSGDRMFPPPDPITLEDGKVVRQTRFATVRPLFAEETANTGFYLPAYMRCRRTGFCYPADQFGLRPFIKSGAKLNATLGEYGAEYTMVFRGDLTLSEIMPDRIVEMQRVPMAPWMHVRRSDMPKIEAFVQKEVDSIAVMNEVGQPLAMVQSQEFLDTMLDRFLDEIRESECSMECERGILKAHEREVPCPECEFRGRDWPEEEEEDQEGESDSNSNSASTGLVTPGGAPLSSADTSSD